MDLQKLTEAITSSWCRETSMLPWAWQEFRPEIGQSHATALVLNDFLGGEIMRGTHDTRPHYWNHTDGTVIIDLTGAYPTPAVHVPRDYLLTFEETAKRYELLKELVRGKLGA